jgi:hypothetical protein
MSDATSDRPRGGRAWPPWILIPLCALLIAAGCSDDGPAETGDGGTSGGDRDAAPPFAGLCPPEFGEKTAGTLEELADQAVVLEGRVIRSQPYKVVTEACAGLGGLAAIHLQTVEGGGWMDDVQILNASREGIFCGCPPEQDAECQDYPPGAVMRLEGTLEWNPLIGEDCYPESCYALLPAKSCYASGCDHDDHCAAGSCNTAAHQCRAQAGDSCDEEVGCDPKDGEPTYCADATPDDVLESARTCRPVGSGREDSVCGEDADCTQCEQCECSDHLCVIFHPAG